MKPVIAIVGLSAFALASYAADKAPYKIAGMMTETCACEVPCVCELTGAVPGHCQGVGTFKFTSGTYAGENLAGATLAYAGKPGGWVRLYIDAPDAARRAAAEKFGRAAFAVWGPIETVKDAKIAIEGGNGGYTVTVDGGKIMTYVTEPILGGDQRTPLSHGNTRSPLTDTFLQAKSSKATVFHDDDRSFEIEAGRNSYFNESAERSGNI